MASISAITSLSKFAILSSGKSSNTRRRGPQSLQEQPHKSISSIFHGHKLVFERRGGLLSSIALLAGVLLGSSTEGASMASEFTDMPALRGKDYGKTKMKYPDYIETESGLQYKDLRKGDGLVPKIGDTVVVDWDGYTIGYYGRIFEARNKTKGGSFVGDDKEFFKFRLGSQQVIPAFEEAVSGMALGGVRSDAGS